MANRSGVVLLIGIVWPLYTVYFAYRGYWPLVAAGVVNIVATADRWWAPKRAERRLTELRAYPDPVDSGDLHRSQSG